MKSKKSFSQKNLTYINQEINSNSALANFIRQLNLNSPKFKKIESILHGAFQSTLYGSGFDFNEIREYKIGDDLRHISWKATARTGNLQTKEYLAEKEIRAYFLVDISNSMFCGNKIDPFIKLYAYLLTSMKRYCEKIGGIYFSDDIKYNFTQAETSSQGNIMFQTLFNYYRNLDKKSLSEPSYTNLTKAITFTKEFFKKRGFIFIISDFLNLQNWEKQIFNLSQHQNIFLFQIYDPLDFEISNVGYISMIDPETNKRIVVNTDNNKIIESYKRLMKEKQEKINALLKQVSAKHVTVSKDDFLQ